MVVDFFDIENNRVVLTPEVLLIPEMRAVWEHYKHINPICYIVFRVSTARNNIYRDEPEDTIDQVLLKDFPGDYKITDDLIVAAIEKLESLEPTIVRYYRSIKKLVEKLSTYANTAIIDDSKDGNIAHVLRMVKEAQSVIATFSKAEKDIEQAILPKNKKKLAYDIK